MPARGGARGAPLRHIGRCPGLGCCPARWPERRELARAARWLRPKLPVLLASGYAADVLAQHGADGEFELLAKSFRSAELLQHIANVTRGSQHQVRAMGLSETAGSR